MRYTRYFAFWHDGSTTGNHSQLLITVNVLYDPASFLSDEEYYLKYKKNTNFQATIEEPQLYLLARCPSNDQQILYSEERVTDLLKMQKLIQCPNGAMINDVARFFKRNSPACQFEAGQQKGGNFFCASCSIHSNNVKKIYFSNKKEIMSLQDQIEKVKTTTMSQIKLQKQQLKLYERFSKTEITQEFHQSAVKFTSTLTKKDLMDILSYEMHGMQRLPALWYDYPNHSMEERNFSHYEILPNESLHDVSNYIKNIYQELPSHMINNEKKIVIEVIDQLFNGKEARNSSDYR